MNFKKITTIGLTKETESPENPGGLEKRVAMIPKHVKSLVESGCKVFVEKGAGEGVGYSDAQYTSAGATLQSGEEIYLDKDMVLKFKGPSLENTRRMSRGTILFCMAHFRSFPERAQLMQDCGINVIAMEEILESPKHIPDSIIWSKCFVEELLATQDEPYENLDIGFIAYQNGMLGGIRRAGNRNPKSLTLYQEDIKIEEMSKFGENSIYFYDSRLLKDTEIIEDLNDKDAQLYDLKTFFGNGKGSVISDYRKAHPPFEFGGRRIQCLHVTGQAGARYGFKLFNKKKARASVLGYGNVGMGAIHECYDQGVRAIQILGRGQTTPEKIGPFLKNSDIIINGAEQAPELRGVNYLIKSSYVGDSIAKGSVVIDLVGGSKTNRSPVEDIVECSYLTDPHFERDGVTFSGLWGWPMMGMMKESADTYSEQTLDVLLNREKLIEGLGDLAPGVKRALVCGPFVKEEK